MPVQEILCTSEYHVPTRIVQQAFAGWYLYCDCQDERCGNVQFENANDAERFAYGIGEFVVVQPCLVAAK